jgi:Uma2 family endonuclease
MSNATIEVAQPLESASQPNVCVPHDPGTPMPRTFTVADLAALPDDLPSGPVLWEMDNGRLIAMAPPGDIHGGVEFRISGRLYVDGELKGHGVGRCGEVGIILWRAQPKDKVVGADAVFIAKRSLPLKVSEEGYLETIPELVVEVRSKNDTDASIAQKVQDYLTAGVSVVWVADPKKKSVTVHRSKEQPRVLTGDETLTVKDIIPGMQIRVKDVFEE